MGDELFKLLTYFIIYSFLGWVMESTFRSVLEKKIINTGFLIGPLCPIYGIGACIMFLFLDKFYDNVVILFLVSIVSLTLWEYIVGVLLEKVFNTKYWDYSNQKFNFQGRICLFNSLCWGVLGVIFIKYIHPFIQELVKKVDIHVLHYVILIATVVFLIDMIVSIVKVKNIKVTLQKIEDLNQEIKEKLKEIKSTSKDAEKNADKLEVAKSLHELVEDLKKKRNRTILHLYRNVYRLKKAFPAIDTKEIREILNKKLEVKKKKEKKKPKEAKKPKKIKK